jgi:predicted Holliday junction resolvase-like endonuclease
MVVEIIVISLVAFSVLLFLGLVLHTAGVNQGKAYADLKIGELSTEIQYIVSVAEEAGQQLADAAERANTLATELAKVKSQKKSSEVRTGLIAEQMAPFLEAFPYEPGKAIFLGKPLDFLVFDDDGIHFVEVKSGNAQLSGRQRMIRDQLKEKKVTFEVYRIKGE